jgi:hypothetical protein
MNRSVIDETNLAITIEVRREVLPVGSTTIPLAVHR